MASIIELLIIFLGSFGINLIPFVGPSNLLIASTAAVGIVGADPATLLLVGVLVALGSALAKGIHYMITFFISGHLSEKRQKRLDADAVKVKRWAFLMLFAAAATPIPDEPIVYPLGLMKYSPVKFFVAFLLGKLSITIVGAFLGSWTEGAFSGILSQSTMIILSIVLTIVVTVVLLKVDLGKLAERFMKRKPKNPETETQTTS